MNLSIRANLSTQEIDGELVILDKDKGQIHQLNQVASIIWQQIEKGLNKAEIQQHLIKTFEIDTETANKDLEKTVQQFKDLQLLDL